MSTRTVIRGGWVVAYANASHVLVPDGVVIIDDDRVVSVLPDYDGHADIEIDATSRLVSPGFIDTHVHIGLRATHRLIADSGRKQYFGQPYWHWTIAKPGTHFAGDLRYDSAVDDQRNPDRLAVTFTAVELLRNGITTFFEMGSRVSLLKLLAEEVERLGTRAYLGAGYESHHVVGTDDGRFDWVAKDGNGAAEMDLAVDFARRYDGNAEGRIRGALVPRETDGCDLPMLEKTAELMRELDMPVQIHAAYSPWEWAYVVHQHGCTPIELLERAGLLGPGVIVGHGQLVAENPLTNWPGGRDLEILGSTGTTVAHSPVNIMRRGRALNSFTRYRAAGVNLALGTDTFPRDMIMQLRMASYMAKILTGDFAAAAAEEVFEAATLGGAKALGRDDLGRIAPGSKADIAIIDMRPQASMRYGMVRDPIKALVDCGIGDDVQTVLVDGVVRMRDREITGVDLEALLDDAQEYAERYWAGVQDWDPLGRPAEEQCPWSFPMYETSILRST